MARLITISFWYIKLQATQTINQNSTQETNPETKTSS